jgi:hypothetical protein
MLGTGYFPDALTKNLYGESRYSVLGTAVATIFSSREWLALHSTETFARAP